MMNTEPLIRVTVCVNRRPGMTEDEFSDYWVNNHGPLATEWLLRCGIVRYVQVRNERSQISLIYEWQKAKLLICHYLLSI